MTASFYKLGFGTWRIGGTTEPDPDNDDQADIISIQNAVENGIRHIDTAELYADGKAEQLVGQAIAPYKRSDLFIASKVRESKLNYNILLESCSKSLERLKTDYLDLYYVHKPNPDIPAEETAAALNELVRQKMVRHIGISNAGVETMKKYATYLETPIFAAQCHYNLIVREPVLKGVLEYCRQNNIRFIAWRPIQLPSEKLGIHGLFEKNAYPLLDQIAAKYNVSNAQIAVRWLTAQENVHLIFKTGKLKHLREIIDAENLSVEAADLQALTDHFPRQESIGFTTNGPSPLI
ncbi:MAG: aldo/keto reductase [Alphaproteobacteria bacterium]|nr:aldo/keto reductase [Alphaproteobacteria bacterium]